MKSHAMHKPNADINLEVKSFDGSTAVVAVNGSDTIGHLKHKIAKQTDVDWLYDHQLFYNRTCLINERTVSAHGLYDGCCVKWRERRQITVVTDDGQQVDLKPWGDATVRKVKRMVEKKKGMSISQQVLKYNGMELSDSCTIRECGIQCFGKLHMVTRETPCFSFFQHRDLSQRISSVEVAMREKHQQLGETCRELSETDEQLDGRMSAVEWRVATLEAQVSHEAPQKNIPCGTIQERFDGNFTSFFDIELEVADYLYETRVLNRDKYNYIFDENTQLSKNQRVRVLLREVMKSESNIKAFHQALLRQGDVRSQELAVLLE